VNRMFFSSGADSAALSAPQQLKASAVWPKTRCVTHDARIEATRRG